MRIEMGRYTIETKIVEADPSEPEWWYWHLYRNGVKINGGLAMSEEEAVFKAGAERMKDNGEWAPSMMPSERI